MAPLLQAIDIGKTYPGGVVANDGVNLTVNVAEVHAVVGENGAGKSTLMKIMFGVEQADRGQLRLAGEPVRFANPRAAIDAGIGMVSSTSRWCRPFPSTRTSCWDRSRAPASASIAGRRLKR